MPDFSCDAGVAVVYVAVGLGKISALVKSPVVVGLSSVLEQVVLYRHFPERLAPYPEIGVPSYVVECIIGENDLLQRTLFTCEDSYNSRFVGIEYIVDEYYTVEVERLRVRMYQ